MTSSPAHKITIRPALLEDAHEIARIRNIAAQNSTSLWTSKTFTDIEAKHWLQPAIQRRTALVALTRSATTNIHSDSKAVCNPDAQTQASKVVAFALATPWRDLEGFTHTVEDSIYVAQPHVGLGIGSLLLPALITASAAVGDRTMVAAIESRNQHSIFLHKQQGFKVCGTIPQAGEKHGQILDLTLLYRDLT